MTNALLIYIAIVVTIMFLVVRHPGRQKDKEIINKATGDLSEASVDLKEAIDKNKPVIGTNLKTNPKHKK